MVAAASDVPVQPDTPVLITVRTGVTSVAVAGPAFSTVTLTVTDSPSLRIVSPGMPDWKALTLVMLSRLTSMVRSCLSICGSVGGVGESWTWTLKSYGPGSVGVPQIRPVAESKVSPGDPGGKLPLRRVQVRVKPLPPIDRRSTSYGLPATATGSATLMMVSEPAGWLSPVLAPLDRPTGFAPGGEALRGGSVVPKTRSVTLVPSPGDSETVALVMSGLEISGLLTLSGVANAGLRMLATATFCVSTLSSHPLAIGVG
mgnify:CR=1 FL=1